MKKLLLIAVCLIVLASTVSAIYNVTGLSGGGDDGLITPVIEGGGSETAPIKCPTTLSGAGDTEEIGDPSLNGMGDSNLYPQPFSSYPDGGEALSDW